MAVWKWTGGKFEGVSIRRENLGLDAYLYCPGPSLAGVKDADIHVPGAMTFAINTAYPHIRPDVWMGLDRAECYDRTLWDQPFMKMCRGNYNDMLCAGRPVKTSLNTHFLDTSAPPQDAPYSFIIDRGDKFTWHKNTLMWAIDIMVHMGAKRIHFVGCDMGGATDYHDGRELPSKQRKENQALYSSQVKSLKVLMPMLEKIGVQCISCTYITPLNRFMKYKSLGAALASTASRSVNFPVVTATATESAKNKICAITPTRGDRPGFIDAWRGMMDRQTRPVDKIYLMDYAPEMDGNDQRQRVIRGAEQALADGFSRALVIEDDDFYRNDYVETMMEVWPKGLPLIGSWYYNLYHVKERCRVTYNADQLSPVSKIKGSPLHATGFDIETFLRFAKSEWLGKCPNLDQDLWGWAQHYDIPRKLIEIPRLIISVKHGVGKQAGGCHTSLKDRRGVKMDPDLSWLKRHTDPAVHEFYEGFGREDKLTELANRYGTDKGTVHREKHGYTKTYHRLFEELREKPVRLLEIGVSPAPPHQPKKRVQKTPSLSMWREYMPNATVLGFDILKREGVFQGDQNSTDDWTKFKKVYPEKMDIIIDDGSHIAEHQLTSFKCMWDHLNPGGYYCIEDLGLSKCEATRAWIKKWNPQIGEVVHWDGKLAIMKKHSRVVVYTSIIGGIDDAPKPPTNIPPYVDLKCYTDRDEIKSDVWEMVPVSSGTNPRRRSRDFKIKPHKYLSEYDYSVWVDAHARLDLRELGGWVKQQLNGSVVACPAARDLRYSSFNCIYEYGAAAIKTMKNPEFYKKHKFRHDESKQLASQLNRYREEGVPEDSGIPYAALILRKHNDPKCISLMDEWQAEYDKGIERDMYGLTKVYSKTNGEFRLIDLPNLGGRLCVGAHSGNG